MLSSLQALMPSLLYFPFVFCFGAAVGSFVNVLAGRIPIGMSVVRPPSRCPSCGSQLKWFENLPVIGWIMLRGHCRTCKLPISVQYPVIEVLVGVVICAVFALHYDSIPSTWLAQGESNWWRNVGFLSSLPAFGAFVVLIACLTAAALIDARTFLVPMSLTRFALGAGVVGWTLQAIIAPGSPAFWPPIPVPYGALMTASLGAGIGLIAANVLLAKGVLRRSFADYESYLTDHPTLTDYPHSRREMGPEALFCGVVIAFGLVGYFLDPTLSPMLQHPLWQVLASVSGGIVIGGGIVWAARILGTLGFGREAMGLGDVHLMAAAGAVLGWRDPAVAFLLAPFPALGWIIFSRIISRGGSRRELPFGPHLVIAIVLVLVFRPVLIDLGQLLWWIPPENMADFRHASGVNE
ncbi:MAG: prepilin peptidase [Planctomycetota bacterium]|nr:prepilin peptidase [Planctomycetota bacterium]